MRDIQSRHHVSGADVQATWLESRVHQLLRQLARDVDYMLLHFSNSSSSVIIANVNALHESHLLTSEIGQLSKFVDRRFCSNGPSTPAVTTIRFDRPSTGSPKGVVTLNRSEQDPFDERSTKYQGSLPAY
jgi:hypothetical protein